MSFHQWADLMAEGLEWSGEHFWSLMGKLAVTLGIPIAVPILVAMFWLGQLSTRVETQEKATAGLLSIVSSLVTFSGQETERSKNNADEIVRLRDAVERLTVSSRARQ